MATYPIKMLRDEDRQPFVPFTNAAAVVDSNNVTLQELMTNGKYKIQNNVTTSSAGKGVLDAYQGKVLNDKFNNYVPLSQKGVANGVATLDADAKVPSSQLPSYVDDVIEAYIRSGATALSSTWLSLTDGGAALTPEKGKIYLIMSSGSYQNKQYRWSGSTYVLCNPSDVNSVNGFTGVVTLKKLTIQKNGTQVGDTFNGSADKVINLSIPTKTSDITNNSGFITAADDITGNAATATKLETARTIATTGDIVSSGTFDGSNNLTLSTRRRGASVGQSTNATANPWYKVASTTLSASYNDRWITFLVNGAYNDFKTKMGILKAQFRTNGNGLWEYGGLWWELFTTDINLDNFVLAYKNNESSVTVEIWCKVAAAYNGYHFEVLGEGSRDGRNSREWTLYTTWTAGSQASLPDGYTTIISTASTLGNWTSGNAGTATKLKTSRQINTVDFDGSVNITVPYVGRVDYRNLLKPSTLKKSYMTFGFGSLGGLDGSSNDNQYVDFLGMNSWDNDSGGRVNAIVATKKPSQALYHYTGTVDADTWTGKKQIAYTDSNITGNAATATKATKDSADQQINTTYIKGLSVNGKVITYTKGDNTTGTITTQDTIYTLPVAGTGIDGTLGGIKVGSGLSIDAGTGVLSATGEGTIAENVEWSGVLNKPTKVSYWTNDANYITLANVMAGATASTAGKAGVVPAPGSGDQAKYLRGDGQWAAVAEATKATQDGSGNTITSTYVKKAGDTMSGNLTIQKASPKLTIKASDTTDAILAMGNSQMAKDVLILSSGDANGANLVIQSGAATILSSGEAGSSMLSFIGAHQTTEKIYLVSDDVVHFDSNAQTFANRVGFQLNNAGQLLPTVADVATNNKGSIGTANYKWASIYTTLLDGPSTSLRYYTNRPTTADTQYGDGKLRYFIASSSMTEGKPIFSSGTAQDAEIIHLPWDNTNGYDAQIAILNNSGELATRGQQAGEWGEWRQIVDSKNHSSILSGKYVTLDTNQTITGTKTFSKSGGFVYSGIETSSSNSDRAVWYGKSGANGTPTINASQFTYNPGTNTLSVGIYNSTTGRINLTSSSHIVYNSTDKCIEFNFE